MLCRQVDGGSLPSALPVEKGMKVLPRELDGDDVRGIQEVCSTPNEIACDGLRADAVWFRWRS